MEIAGDSISIALALFTDSTNHMPFTNQIRREPSERSDMSEPKQTLM